MLILEAAVCGLQELDEDMINSIMLVVQMDDVQAIMGMPERAGGRQRPPGDL